MRTITAIAMLIAVTAGMAGCRLRREYIPQPVTTVGVGYLPDLASTPTTGAVRPEVFPPGKKPIAGQATAPGSGTIPSSALDPLQAKLIAKQRAKQEARRQLAEEVAAVRLPDGRTVGEAIRENVALREQVEAMLRDAQQKGEIDTHEQTCTVLLSVDLDPLNSIFNLMPDTTPTMVAEEPGAPEERFPGRHEGLREAAREAALRDARARMFEYVTNVRLPRGGTIGDVMRGDRELALAIQQRIEDLEPTYRFIEDDVCEASVTMDIAEIQRLLDENRRGGWFGWG